MPEFLKNFFADESFMPHGHCFLWYPDILWLHVISDIVIAFSYIAISASLLYAIRKIYKTHYRWVFAMFAAFTLACAATHIMNIIVMWHPLYRLEAVLKALAAAISLATATLLLSLIPRAAEMYSLYLGREESLSNPGRERGHD